MRRIILVATLTATSGCSFGMKTVDSNWDGASEPDCTADIRPLVGDSIVAGAGLAVSSIGVQADSGAMVLGGLLVGVAFGVAAIVGESNRNDCKEALAAWRIGGAIGTASEVRRERIQPLPAAPPVVVKQPPATPRGWFCYSSPTVAAAGDCYREKAACTRARDGALVGVPDLTACELREAASCAGVGEAQACFPTGEVCKARVTMVRGTPCEERF